jgi:hypothetical protein
MKIEPLRSPEHEEIMGSSSITINRKEIPVMIKFEQITGLLFYPENPRIYSIVRAGGAVPSQDDIYEALKEKSYVHQLVKDIRENGGLLDPIIVRTETMEVLEGNGRLAAHRILSENDPSFGRIKAMMLPESFDDNMLFALLNQYHLKGKTKWEPYERAGFLYRRWKRTDPSITIEELSRECVEDPNEVKTLLNAYEFMTKHELQSDQWSYAYEFIKSNIIKKRRESITDFDERVVEKIKSGELGKATDVRDKLRDVCKNEKALKRFLGDAMTLDEAHAELEDTGATSAVFNRMKNFNVWLHDQTKLEARLKTARGHELERLKIEFGKLSKRVKRLEDRYMTKAGGR